jgi:hypothetical protein
MSLEGFTGLQGICEGQVVCQALQGHQEQSVQTAA